MLSSRLSLKKRLIVSGGSILLSLVVIFNIELILLFSEQLWEELVALIVLTLLFVFVGLISSTIAIFLLCLLPGLGDRAKGMQLLFDGICSMVVATAVMNYLRYVTTIT